ncbi:hypothetical protein ACFQ14_01035 [Pseudahrensia aquimaris]|uniref:Uncharacterized protein n=1 Tax=Pseudahrensia aquimaris TaxID=744461 RepID=A0ABW3FCJ4_9HYPH
MYAQTALPLFDTSASTALSHLPQLGFGEPTRRAPSAMACTVRRQRFVRSVVEAEGLGRFAYLHGASGKRYVFSAVRGHQVSLYSRAVFAIASADGTLEQIVTRRELPDCSPESLLYVHLLDEGCADADTVIDDMTA